MNELALFAGAGGGILGGMLLGWRTVCAVECDAYAAGVLCARQNDGILPPFPIWDDVRTFDGRPWRGIVDVVSGGFPCQDISCAGRRAGLSGERSGLWWEMYRIIGEVRPRFVFVENSPMLVIRGLPDILGALSELGYNAEWGIISAADAGAPHLRKRIWILGWHTDGSGGSQIRSVPEPDAEPRRISGTMADDAWGKTQGKIGVTGTMVPNADAAQTRLEGHGDGSAQPAGGPGEGHAWADRGAHIAWWCTEPDVGRVADGVAARVDRLATIGNGQVPAVAALAWTVLHKRLIGED